MKNLYVAAAVAGLVLAAAGCASTSSTSADAGPDGGGPAVRYVDDATVTAKVKTAIATDVGVKAAANVNVETQDGVVQLAGFADSEDQASRAVIAAKKVTGVRSVKNDIRIKR